MKTIEITSNVSKILVVSDTHRSTSRLKNDILPKYANSGLVQLAVHLGDFVQDLQGLQQCYPNLAMVGVAGSMEYGDKTVVLDICGKTKILLKHGHDIGVKSGLDRITYLAQEIGVDACLFGHTHVSAMFENSEIFFMNPGSVTEPRGGSKQSFGILSIPTESTEDKIWGEVVQV